MNTDTLDLLARYRHTLDRRNALVTRIRDRRSEEREYRHSWNTDEATLETLDRAGLLLAKQLATADGFDVDAIIEDVIGRCADDAPQF